MAQLTARGLSLREAVTLASIVELETAQADERPRIAAVFLNRLKLGMPLQTDPTVIYALRKAGTYDGNIRKKDLGVDSPYNTYKRPGLPPGPIASPGREALQAVAAPADAKDLYFVSRNDGTHEFNETLALHERAVDRYQRHRDAPSPRGEELMGVRAPEEAPQVYGAAPPGPSAASVLGLGIVAFLLLLANGRPIGGGADVGMAFAGKLLCSALSAAATAVLFGPSAGSTPRGMRVAPRSSSHSAPASGRRASLSARSRSVCWPSPSRSCSC